MIADACPTCVNGNSIDLSMVAFQAIAPLSDGIVPSKPILPSWHDLRNYLLITVTWSYIWPMSLFTSQHRAHSNPHIGIGPCDRLLRLCLEESTRFLWGVILADLWLLSYFPTYMYTRSLLIDSTSGGNHTYEYGVEVRPCKIHQTFWILLYSRAWWNLSLMRVMGWIRQRVYPISRKSVKLPRNHRAEMPQTYLKLSMGIQTPSRPGTIQTNKSHLVIQTVLRLDELDVTKSASGRRKWFHRYVIIFSPFLTYDFCRIRRL